MDRVGGYAAGRRASNASSGSALVASPRWSSLALVKAKAKPKSLLATAAPSSAPSTFVLARILSQSDNLTQFQAQLDNIRAEHILAVDCGDVVRKHSWFEVRFGCLHPTEEGVLTRLVIARYADRSRFVERAKNNEDFRVRMVDYLRTLPEPGEEPGFFAKPMVGASLKGQSVTLDVEGEAMASVGASCGVILLTASKQELHRASSGKANEFLLHADIELTMPAQVLADILLSWKNLADELMGTPT